jgi:hypothetical protein
MVGKYEYINFDFVIPIVYKGILYHIKTKYYLFRNDKKR